MMSQPEKIIIQYDLESCVDKNGPREDRLAYYESQVAEQQAMGRHPVPLIPKSMSKSGEEEKHALELAILSEATHLCFMTEVEGLFDGGRVFSTVTIFNAEWALKLARKNSRGNMEAKVTAGVLAAKQGIKAHIGFAGFSIEDVITQKTGTHFALPFTPPVVE